MKTSNYNVVFDHDDKNYIFNTLTCALAEVDNEFLDQFDSNGTQIKQHPKIQKMMSSGFVVQDDFDELAFLKYRQYKGLNLQTIRIVVVLTLACNFACPYCYESPRQGVIKEEVKVALYEKIEEILKNGKKVSITWFGGEPLLAKNIIWEMSEKINSICEKYNSVCVYDMATNGYLLDQESVSNMLNVGMNTIQVTIDGIPSIHNSSRKLKSGKGETFETIIKNIKLATSNDMKIKIRINVSKTNVDCLEELVKLLAFYNLQDCFVYVACVRCYSKTKIDNYNTFTAEEFGKITVNFSKFLKQNGFKFFVDLCYPHFIFSSCSAGVESNIVIDPDGYLYRCFVELGNTDCAYGNILDKNIENNINMNNIKYLMCSPFDLMKCKKCKVLPLCMGGCRYYTLKNKGNPDCSLWKYNLVNNLKATCDLIKTK